MIWSAFRNTSEPGITGCRRLSGPVYRSCIPAIPVRGSMVIQVQGFLAAFIRSINIDLLSFPDLFPVQHELPGNRHAFCVKSFFQDREGVFCRTSAGCEDDGFFPSHPFSAAIAALIAGVALNAQTGVPITTRSETETSMVSGSMGVQLLFHCPIRSPCVGSEPGVVLF